MSPQETKPLPNTRPEDLEITIPSLDGRAPWKVKPVSYAATTNREDLNQELAEHSAKVAWIGQLWADAKYEAGLLKIVRDRVEAEEILRVVEENKVKKPTGKEIDAEVALSVKYRNAEEAYLLMVRTLDRLDGMRNTLDHRIQSMISIASSLRREWDTRDPGRTIENIKSREDQYKARLREERQSSQSGASSTPAEPEKRRRR